MMDDEFGARGMVVASAVWSAMVAGMGIMVLPYGWAVTLGLAVLLMGGLAGQVAEAGRRRR